MRISRRNMLYLVGLVTVGCLFGFQRFRPGSFTRSEQDTISAFLDVLIPADEFPSATALGIHHTIFRRAESDVSYWMLLKRTCRWLDKLAQRAGKPVFSALAPQEREVLVEQAVTASDNSAPALFFQTIRDDAFHVYYADPRSWGGLGYPGPPQPSGFGDYTQPPRKGFRP